MIDPNEAIAAEFDQTIINLQRRLANYAALIARLTNERDELKSELEKLKP